MTQKAWDRLNSPIVLWLIGTALVGVVTFFVERHIASRNRIQDLNERFDRLGFELSGRLSQYSGWFVHLLEDPTDLVRPKLLPCVTPGLLRQSVSVLAQRPNVVQVQLQGGPSKDCERPLRFGPVFHEFSKHSTIEILAEMRLVHDELLARGTGRPLSYARGQCKADKSEKTLSDRITNGINAFLNTDAVIPLEWAVLKGVTVEELRGRYMCSFYGIGAEDLWFSDVFVG
jgi:hypothetical protein